MKRNESDEKVIEFMSIASIEYDLALMLMKESGYDLDLAISNFFSSLSAHENNSSNSKSSTQGSNGNSYQKKKDFHDKSDDDYVPPLESLPKPKVMRLVDNYYENADYQPSQSMVFGQNPVEPFRNFKEEKLPDKPGKANLASLFRPPIEICFEDTYEKAMEHGSKHHKYLIVNIQEISVFDCQKLNRDTWSNTTLKEYIKKNFIFWQRTKNMAARFCQYYAPQELPHISVLDPRTGEKLETWEGFMNAQEMLINLKTFLRKHPFEPESIEINDGAPDLIKPKEPVKKPVVKHISDLTEEEQMEEIIKISLLESQEQEDEENRKNNGKDGKDIVIKDEANHLKRKEVNPNLIDDDSQPSRKKMKVIEIDQDDNKNPSKGPIVIEDNNPIYEISEEDFITLSAGEDSCDNENMDEENAIEGEENKENEVVMAENKVGDNQVEEIAEENIPEVDCSLKIRLPNGTVLSKVFTSTCSLYKVSEWIRHARTDIEDSKRRESRFNLLCGHPSKLYTEKDCYKTTLHHAGLVPRGLIFVENP